MKWIKMMMIIYKNAIQYNYKSCKVSPTSSLLLLGALGILCGTPIMSKPTTKSSCLQLIKSRKALHRMTGPVAHFAPSPSEWSERRMFCTAAHADA
mmetsp:Transcript_1437/g.2066  ORF Transcript_1437/g.2066 Transcript_1437/m.2066 type:complete len:96 (+) Transcript_1437:610-897(+)